MKKNETVYMAPEMETIAVDMNSTICEGSNTTLSDSDIDSAGTINGGEF